MSDLKELFNTVILYWPDTINVEEKVFFDNGGARIPELVRVHDEIESKILAEKCRKEIFYMDWAIFTALHGVAKSSKEVSPKKLSFEEVEKIYLDNLSD